MNFQCPFWGVILTHFWLSSDEEETLKQSEDVVSAVTKQNKGAYLTSPTACAASNLTKTARLKQSPVVTLHPQVRIEKEDEKGKMKGTGIDFVCTSFYLKGLFKDQNYQRPILIKFLTENFLQSELGDHLQISIYHSSLKSKEKVFIAKRDAPQRGFLVSAFIDFSSGPEQVNKIHCCQVYPLASYSVPGTAYDNSIYLFYWFAFEINLALMKGHLGPRPYF